MSISTSVSERTCYDFDKAPDHLERLRLCKECFRHVTFVSPKGMKREFCSYACKWKFFNKDGKVAERVRRYRARKNEMLDSQPIQTQGRMWVDEDGVIHEWSREKPRGKQA